MWWETMACSCPIIDTKKIATTLKLDKLIGHLEIILIWKLMGNTSFFYLSSSFHGTSLFLSFRSPNPHVCHHQNMVYGLCSSIQKNGNHYNAYIKPYWWVYDHPLLWENKPCIVLSQLHAVTSKSVCIGCRWDSSFVTNQPVYPLQTAVSHSKPSYKVVPHS